MNILDLIKDKEKISLDEYKYVCKTLTKEEKDIYGYYLYYIIPKVISYNDEEEIPIDESTVSTDKITKIYENLEENPETQNYLHRNKNLYIRNNSLRRATLDEPILFFRENIVNKNYPVNIKDVYEDFLIYKKIYDNTLINEIIRLLNKHQDTVRLEDGREEKVSDILYSSIMDEYDVEMIAQSLKDCCKYETIIYQKRSNESAIRFFYHYKVLKSEEIAWFESILASLRIIPNNDVYKNLDIILDANEDKIRRILKTFPNIDEILKNKLQKFL